MNDNKTLVVWLNNGQTCLFEQVENFDVGLTVIKFEYFGQSTHAKRKAVFNLGNIAGWALEL